MSGKGERERDNDHSILFSIFFRGIDNMSSDVQDF